MTLTDGLVDSMLLRFVCKTSAFVGILLYILILTLAVSISL